MSKHRTTIYDFILFENYHSASNHKYDVLLIAKLLKSVGCKVAILDIYHEDAGERIDGIEVLHLQNQMNIPNDKWQKFPKSKIHSLFSLLRFLIVQHYYMKKVLKEIEPLADSFYCGSYHLGMSRVFFKSQKKCYYWGLRSSRMKNFWYHFKSNPILAFRMLMLKNAFLANSSQHLFVSNDIIKKEFTELGIAENRLIIREERCLEKEAFPDYDYLNCNFSILTIGMLRKEKRIDFSISEFLSTNHDNWEFVLAGKSNAKYESIIANASSGHNNVIRINKFLEYEDFFNLIKQAHFVVLADEKQQSCVTNGTMMEALINYRPIIAPDYEPYNYYVNKYGIGILFNPQEKGDLAKAICKAEKLGCRYFYNKINSFLNLLKFENVASNLKNQIDR